MLNSKKDYIVVILALIMTKVQSCLKDLQGFYGDLRLYGQEEKMLTGLMKFICRGL